LKTSDVYDFKQECQLACPNPSGSTYIGLYLAVKPQFTRGLTTRHQ